jgi:hypothetical protein
VIDAGQDVSSDAPDGASPCTICVAGAACEADGGPDGGFCYCPAGYGGDGTTTGTGCTDINECMAGTSDCVAAPAGGICTNTTGSYSCACATGYNGDGRTTGTGCTDIDECAGTNNCVSAGAGGVCTNTGGSYSCSCASGYAGDGRTNGTGCVDINECAGGTRDCVPTPQGGLCFNTTGSFTCSCATGYSGDGRTTGTGCADVDECAAGTHNCVAAGSGGICANTTGSFTCSCATGYSGDGRTTGTGCTDVDECMAGTHNCVAAASGGVCTNSAGTYSCSCAPGYTGDGRTTGTGCTPIGPVPELLWYRFDGTGTSVPNLASSPPTGTTTATLMGGLTQGSTGQCGGAVIGSGVASSTDYVNTGWATSLSSGSSWSISFWTSDVTPSATLFYIFGDAGASSFRCFTNGVAGANNWIMRGTGFTDVLAAGGAVVAATHTAFVYDSALSQVRAYVNGTLVNTVAQGGFTFSGAGPFKVIGYSSNVGMAAGGKLDEFRLFSRALTQAEITTLATLACQ